MAKKGQRSDNRLLARAIKQRWPISDATRKRAIEAMDAVIKDPLATAREKTAAMRAIASAESQNQQDEQRAEDDLTETIIRLAEQFGIVVEGSGTTTKKPARRLPGGGSG